MTPTERKTKTARVNALLERKLRVVLSRAQRAQEDAEINALLAELKPERRSVVLAALAAAWLLLCGSAAAAPLDDVRARLWLNETLAAGHTNHAPQFYFRDAWLPNALAETATREDEVHPGLSLDVWTRIEDADICRGLGCAAQHAEPGASRVKVAWARNPEPDISGYYIVQGTNLGVFTVSNFVGDVTFATVSVFATNGVTYFAIVAESQSGLTSEASWSDAYDPTGNETLLTIPVRQHRLRFKAASGVAVMELPAGSVLLRPQLGVWTNRRRLTIPTAATLMELLP